NVLTGGGGNDIYVIGAGDTVVELAGGGTDSVQSSVSHTLGAEVENLTLTGSTATLAIGNNLDNILIGNLTGNFLDGDLGDDQLVGGAGNDVLTGGLGRDEMTGGADADSFAIREAGDSIVGTADRILDFTQGSDVIDLSLIDADDGIALDQAFSFIGDALFTSTAGELRAFDSGAGSWFVEGDFDGDGLADFQIEVISPGPLLSGDFVL
ncbi:MAG: M10 family metallopeptidase C-terminal domain-containing protein, partial [Allosphingosinicella sp.]